MGVCTFTGLEREMKHPEKSTQLMSAMRMRYCMIALCLLELIMLIYLSRRFVTVFMSSGADVIILVLTLGWLAEGIFIVKTMMVFDQPVAAEFFRQLISQYLVCGYPLDELLDADVPIRLWRHLGQGSDYWFALVSMLAYDDNGIQARLCYSSQHAWTEFEYLGIWWVVDPICCEKVPYQRWSSDMAEKSAAEVVYVYYTIREIRETQLLERTERFLLQNREDINRLMDDPTLYA